MSDTVYLQVLYAIYEAVKDTRRDSTRATIMMYLRPVKAELERIEKDEEAKRKAMEVQRW